MLRTTLGLAAGTIAAVLAFIGCGYAAISLAPLPPGTVAHSPQAIADWLGSAAPGALACIVAGFGFAALAGGWLAAAIARLHRGGVALALGATIMVLAIVAAALIPQPEWMPVLAMLLPIPLALCAWRLATPRLEM